MPEVTFKFIKSKMKAGPHEGKDFYMCVGEYPKEVTFNNITRNLCVNMILESWSNDENAIRLLDDYLKQKETFTCEVNEVNLVPNSLYLGFGEDERGRFIYCKITEDCSEFIFDALTERLRIFKGNISSSI